MSGLTHALSGVTPTFLEFQIFKARQNCYHENTTHRNFLKSQLYKKERRI